jgi:iron complex transport system substrate-binding protein
MLENAHVRKILKNKNLRRLLLYSLLASVVLSHSAYANKSNIPQRIVSLSPSATEDLFAIGAAHQVIAVDDNSNFPVGVPTTKLSSFNPNTEAIAKYRPELVVIQVNSTKGTVVAKQLRALKIKVYVEKTPTDLSGLYSEISDLGALTGHSKESTLLVRKIKAERLKAISPFKKSNKSFYHELDNTLFSATSSTFIGKVYADFGLKNIADAASKADDGGYPQLQNEYLIASDPNIIFLADAQYGEDANKVALRPGWSEISAVKTMKIISLPADISSRWGPRIIDFYLIVADALS